MKLTLTSTALIAVSFLMTPRTAQAQAADTAKAGFVGSCQILSNSVPGLVGNATAANCTLEDAIPPQKILVIEQAAAVCSLHSSATPPAFRSVRFQPRFSNAPGSLNAADVPFVDSIVTLGDNGAGGMIRTWLGVIRGRFYSTAAPKFFINRFPGNVTDSNCNFTVSGYLVDK